MTGDALPARAGQARTNGIGLYIHVPFCVRKCRYCDFYSICDLSLVPRFTAALQREISAQSQQCHTIVDTVYFGGGTPSLLTPRTIEALLNKIHSCFHLTPDAEITLEVNPGTVDAAQLDAYRRIGLNRLSVGVQSFHPDELKLLGRLHTANQSRQLLHRARSAGFENIGIDLIYAIPGQTPARWKATLAAALDFSPEHLSCYGLTFEAGTPLAADRDRGRIVPVADPVTAALYRTLIAELRSAGYHQYEVSNFCRQPQLASRHNLKYWNFKPYLGLGPAAHSFVPPERCWNPSDIAAYLQALESGAAPVAACETLSRDQVMVEAVYLGLRQTPGIDPEHFRQRFQADFDHLFGALTRRFRSRGLMTFNAGRWALTLEGMLLLDHIAAEMVACLPDE